VTEHLSRLIEDEPCTCFSPEHKFWCAKRTADLVPGYAASRDGQADAAEQRKADAR
jgi:hypothetical protein